MMPMPSDCDGDVSGLTVGLDIGALDRLEISPEIWLQAVGQFGKRRTPNQVTLASRFNAAATPISERNRPAARL